MTPGPRPLVGGIFPLPHAASRSYRELKHSNHEE